MISPTRSRSLRFDGRKRVHNGDEIMAAIVAKRLVDHLECAGFVIMRKPPGFGAAALGRGHGDNEMANTWTVTLAGVLSGNGLQAEAVILQTMVRQPGTGVVAAGKRRIEQVAPALPDGVYTLTVDGNETAMRCHEGSRPARQTVADAALRSSPGLPR